MQIKEAIAECYKQHKYILDPHGACAWRALRENLHDGETGIFLETAHPAKFKETVESVINTSVEIPQRLAAFMEGEKQSTPMNNKFDDFKQFLIRSNQPR